MKDLQNLVTPEYAANWKIIGASLGFSNGAIDIIDHDNYHRAEDCCNAVWERWLDEDISASWNKVFSIIDQILSNAVADELPCSNLEVILPEVSCILQAMYVKKRFEVSDDDWPPYQPEVYTTVALIHHMEKITTKKAVISIAKQMHKGEIALTKDNSGLTGDQENSYLAGCKYANVLEIFPPQSGSSGKPTPYSILIEGAPGIGKTVLSKEVAFLWANGTLLQHKKVLFLIFLRDPSIQRLTSFAGFAKYVTCARQQSKIVGSFTEYLINTSGKDLLFVFDGYDELPEMLRKESFVADIINRKILPCCDIVITSRPAASAHLHQQVEQRIEVLGFTNEDRKKYICQALRNNPTKVYDILAYLQSNPFIDSLCYIPLNMTILMCLFTEATQSELPKTQTEINNQFICMTISRYFRKKEKILLSISSLYELQGKYKKLLRELSKLAFNLLGKDKIVFNSADIHSKSLLSNNLNGMGLLKAVKYFSFVDNCEQISFNFLHFSLQEFLAAFHIASSSTTDQEKIIRQNFWSSRYLNTWIMYCGLTGGNSLALKHYLSGNRFIVVSKLFGTKGISQSTIDNKIKCLHLFQCFLEASNVVMCEQVGSFLHNREIDLSGQVLLPKDIHTLGFFLTRSSNKQWEVLNLSGCYIEGQGIEILAKTYLELLNSSTVKVLDISNNHIMSSSLHDVFKLVLKLKVQKLKIINNGLTNESISKELFICTVSNRNHYFHLPLKLVVVNNNAGNTSRNSSTTDNEEELYVINAKSHYTILKDLIETATFNVHTLYIWNCKSKVSDIVLLENKCGTKVSMFSTNLQTSEVTDWQKFKNSKTSIGSKIDWILKSDDALSIFGAHHNFNEVVLNTTYKDLSTLHITNCFLTHEALGHIGVIISNSEQHWKVIDLSDCRIDDEGFDTLCNHISRTMIVIKLLDFSNNYFTATSIPTIVKLFHFCLIDECNISYNYISDTPLRDALLSKVHKQHSVVCNFIHKQPLIVINDSKHLHLNVPFKDGNFCSIYLINCQIDNNIIQYLGQNHLPIGSLVLANNIFLDNNIITLIASIIEVKVATFNMLTFDLTDEVALEISMKLKKITFAHGDNKTIHFILKSQTALLAYNTSGKQIKNSVIQNSSNNICKIQVTDCHNIDDRTLDAILGKCSPNLNSIDISSNSIKDNYCATLLTHLSNFKLPIHLKTLDLSNNNLTSNFIEMLIKILCHCTVEKLLVASNDNIDYHKLNITIVSHVQTHSSILNFVLGVPLFVLFTGQYNLRSCAYVYIVNCSITKEIIKEFNTLSMEEVFVHDLVLCNNKINLDCSEHFLALDRGQYLSITTTEANSLVTDSTERSDWNASGKVIPVRNSNYILVCNKLLIFIPVCHQLTEVLTNHDEIDSLEFINCNISNLELHEVKKIISSKDYWKLINLSGCNIGDDGCSALYPQEGTHYNVIVTQLNLSCNNLRSSSLKDIIQLILCWKTKVLIISGNDIDQYEIMYTITSMVKYGMFENCQLQLQVLTIKGGIYAFNTNNCLSASLQQYTFGFCTAIDHNSVNSSVDSKEFLLSLNTTSLTLNVISESGLSCEVPMSEIVQAQPLHALTIVAVEQQNELKSNMNEEYCIYIIQEIQFSTPFCHLCVTNSDITDEEACQISKHINHKETLESIEIANCNIDEQSFIKILTSLEHSSILKHISISFIVITDKAAQLLASVIGSNPCLEFLCASHCKLKGQEMLTIIKSLRMIKSLRHCDLSNNCITDKCVILLSLVITANKFALSHLNLSNCHLQEEELVKILEALKEVSSLIFLSLSTNTINVTSAIKLSKVMKVNVKLKYLDLSNCNLAETGFIIICKSLNAVSYLKHLNIAGNKITNDVAEHLAYVLGINSILDYLNLSCCQLQEQGLCRILHPLCESSVSHHLNVNLNIISDQTVYKLYHVITASTSLTALGISSCDFSEKRKSTMCELLTKDGRVPLMYLDVSLNNIGSLIAGTVAKTISPNIEYLDMSGCNLSKADLMQIVRFVRSNIKLSHLNISNNDVADNVATEIASIIKGSVSLQYINLCNCNLHDVTLITIADALSSIKTLKTLIVSNNDISNIGANCVAAIIKVNVSLEYVDFSNCRLQEVGKSMIKHALQKVNNLKFSKL